MVLEQDRENMKATPGLHAIVSGKCKRIHNNPPTLETLQ